jgi:hypothetical protein
MLTLLMGYVPNAVYVTEAQVRREGEVRFRGVVVDPNNVNQQSAFPFCDPAYYCIDVQEIIDDPNNIFGGYRGPVMIFPELYNPNIASIGDAVEVYALCDVDYARDPFLMCYLSRDYHYIRRLSGQTATETVTSTVTSTVISYTTVTSRTVTRTVTGTRTTYTTGTTTVDVTSTHTSTQTVTTTVTKTTTTTITKQQTVLKVLVVGTCYSDEDFDECRKMLLPELDTTREDNAIRKAVQHLERELLGKYKIIVRPEKPLVVRLPHPSGKYPDIDESTRQYDPPIRPPPLPSGYRHDTEDALRKAGYEPAEYNAILAIQTDRVLWRFNLKDFRARTEGPNPLRSWAFAALALYSHVDRDEKELESWPTYAHELGHALFSLPDYYECRRGLSIVTGRGQLYGWSLMGNEEGWNGVWRSQKDGDISIRYYVGDGALLDVINKVSLGVLKLSLVQVPTIIDLTPTEQLSLGDKAYMVQVVRPSFQVYKYYIEARSVSVDNDIKREQKIEGGVLLYRQEGGGCWFYVMNSKYKNAANPHYAVRYPTLFLSEDKETSRLVDPAAFMVFTLIDDMDASPQSYKPRVKVEFCTPQICGNIRGVVITAQLGQVPPQALLRNLTYRLDLHAVTADGLHVGFNYAKGEYEIMIPGAYASGPGQMQWIFVPRDLDVRFYVRYVLEGPEAGSWDLPIVFNSTWIEYGPNSQVINGTKGIEITDSYIQADAPRTIRAGEQMEIKPGETKTTHTQTTTSTTLEATTLVTNIRNIDYRLLTLLALASLFMIFIAVIAYSYSPKGGIKCTSCGSRNRRGAIYCRRCGNRLRS